MTMLWYYYSATAEMEIIKRHQLKMLGLYLFTFIIGQKSCNMLSILNKLTFQKELQNFVTNNVLLGEKVKTQPQQNKT